MTRTLVEETKGELTEAEAIRRAQGGDAAAFEYLYSSHSRHVYNLCLRMVRNTHDAEDLTQQIFLQVFRKIATFRGDSSFSTWLHRVTVNAVLMHVRRKKLADISTDDLGRSDAKGDVPREAGAEDPSLLDAIDRLNLRRAVRKLPPGYRQLFLLHDVLGYKHWEIAGILRCSTGSSKSQLHKARKRLRCLLQGEQWTAEPASSPSPDAENSGRTDTVCNLAIPSESKCGARLAPLHISARKYRHALPRVLLCSTQRSGFSLAESLRRVFSRNQKSRAQSVLPWQGLPMRSVANEAFINSSMPLDP
jgi:RNA polymerase sigma-70 factor (ECF subfamily)